MTFTKQQKKAVISRLMQYEFMLKSKEMCLGDCDWCEVFDHRCCRCPANSSFTDEWCDFSGTRLATKDGDLTACKERLNQLLRGCEKLDLPVGGNICI